MPQTPSAERMVALWHGARTSMMFFTERLRSRASSKAKKLTRSPPASFVSSSSASRLICTSSASSESEDRWDRLFSSVGRSSSGSAPPQPAPARAKSLLRPRATSTMDMRLPSGCGCMLRRMSDSLIVMMLERSSGSCDTMEPRRSCSRAPARCLVVGILAALRKVLPSR